MTEQFGLGVSETKSKVMANSKDANIDCGIKLNAGQDQPDLEVVTKYKYLGHTFSSDGSINKELSRRTSLMWTAYTKLKRQYFDHKYFNHMAKGMTIKIFIMTVLLYACSTWTMKKTDYKNLDSQMYKLLCSISKCRRYWKIQSNESEGENGTENIKLFKRAKYTQLLELFGLTSVEGIIRKRRLLYIGRVTRMDDNRLPKQILYGIGQKVKINL